MNTNLKRLLTACVVATSVIQVAAGSADKYDTQIEALLSKMTLQEKLGQLNLISNPYISTGAGAADPQADGHNADIDEQVRSGNVGNFLNVLGAEETYRLQKIAAEESRLGIPLLFGYDVIHGYKTMFPIPLADASSFDREAMEMSAHYMSKEAAANGLNWTYAPMVDISRDARWGRIMESSGEDVYLGCEAATARVKGIQGDDMSDELTIAACAKHFVAYGGAIAGRDYGSVDVSERMLREVYFPPFQAAVDAGVASFMSSFNTVSGEPASTSEWLMKDVLRGEWGFDGFVVSDWASVAETIYHGSSAGELEAAYGGLNAMVDMDMCGYLYINHTEELINAGRISIEEIDDMVRNVLRIKFRLGLFDDPYKYSNLDRQAQLTLSEENHAASREVARRSMVLLKNEAQLLPLSKDVKRIAVIGPLATDKDTPLGNWRGQAESHTAVSLLEGIQAAVGTSCEVIYAQGCRLENNESTNFFTQLDIETLDRSGFAEAIEAARSADVVIMALGETAYMSGECRSYADISLKGLQSELLAEIRKVGTPIVTTLFTGRPLVLTHDVPNTDALLNCWLLGSESGNAIADVLFGDYNPSGKLPASFPYHLGQVPIYYSEMSSGRPYNPVPESFSTKYRDVPNTPLFAFGYGLSYTTFDYSALELSSDLIGLDDELTIKVTVKNSGEYDGHEVVQLYIHDIVADRVARPVLELKGFEKIFIKSGESATVEFKITPDDLAFYRLDKSFAPEAGEFTLYVGTSSDNLPLSTKFTLTE
ncbi:MAG: beta-glucosidase BglX [Rikenellaceae bacterium]